MRPILFAVFAAGALLAGTPAKAQLLGLEQFLSPPSADYDAELAMTADGQTIDGKIMRAHDMERRELTVEGEPEIMIIRLDRRLIWSLAPEEKLYVEASLDEALGRVPGPGGKPREPQVTVTTVGTETVAGQRASKKKVSGKDADGLPLEGTVWLSDQGIVLRAESDIVDEAGKHHLLRLELRNLHIGPQNAALFEVPAGFKRVTRARAGALEPPRRARHGTAA